MLLKFLKNTEGATAIEYCLIAGVISIVIVGGARQIGANIYKNFYGPLGGAFN